MKIKPVKALGLLLVFVLLTIITQVGGILFLFWLPIGILINRKLKDSLQREIVKPLSFICLYIVATFSIIPMIAKSFGRVPIGSTSHIQPLTMWTFLLNRHYVRPTLKQALEMTAGQMNEAFPGTQIAYLDANFPFMNGFPLIPHLSHNDGKKLDIAFFYKRASTDERLNGLAPSWMGYGVHEGPLKGEVNMPNECANKGNWQYGFMERIIPQYKKEVMPFDGERTRAIISLLVAQPAVSKIFIEPHLKTRLRLNSQKIRFHGCQAVRHDDHIHMQIR